MISGKKAQTAFNLFGKKKAQTPLNFPNFPRFFDRCAGPIFLGGVYRKNRVFASKFFFRGRGGRLVKVLWAQMYIFQKWTFVGQPSILTF